jgi:hypothetical protein
MQGDIFDDSLSFDGFEEASSLSISSSDSERFRFGVDFVPPGSLYPMTTGT